MKALSTDVWSADSWRSTSFQLVQDPYDENHMASILKVSEHLRILPPLVSGAEIYAARRALADIAENGGFIVQGGECAEEFGHCTKLHIDSLLKTLSDMRIIIDSKVEGSVIILGRIAGQYCKPRSSTHEILAGDSVLSYRGDGINDYLPNNRRAEPERLREVYFHSAATLNYVRTSTTNIGTNFFTSHEGLNLSYESSLVRYEKQGYVCSSAHVLWIGLRTCFLNSAHVEFCRGIGNAIGLKFNDSIQVEELINICKRLNPDNEKGKIILVARMGATVVQEMLPIYILGVENAACNVLWMCDPVHGNTYTAGNGFKYRKFEDVEAETIAAAEIHRKLNVPLRGIHVECAGTEVTECIGGPPGTTLLDLPRNYASRCDPRLSPSQTNSLATSLSSLI